MGEAEAGGVAVDEVAAQGVYDHEDYAVEDCLWLRSERSERSVCCSVGAHIVKGSEARKERFIRKKAGREDEDSYREEDIREGQRGE